MKDDEIRVLEFQGVSKQGDALVLDVRTVFKPWGVKPLKTQKEIREWQRLLQKDAAKREDATY